MEQLVGEHGLAGLLAGILVVLALHVVVKTGHFIFDLFKKKHEITDKHIESLIAALSQNVEAIHRLDDRIRLIETSLRDFDKFKLDMRRSFQALKFLSGDKWGEIRRMFMEDN